MKSIEQIQQWVDWAAKHNAAEESILDMMHILLGEVKRLAENNKFYKAQNDENSQAYEEGCEVNRRQYESLRHAVMERDRYKVIAEAADALRGGEIDRMVNKFLAWPLPESVCADLCTTRPGGKHRIGTNLLTAIEARQMLEYLFL